MLLPRRGLAESCDPSGGLQNICTPVSYVRTHKGTRNSSGPGDADEVNLGIGLMKVILCHEMTAGFES